MLEAGKTVCVMSASGAYVPALGFRFLTPLYDPLVRLTLREEEFKRRLIEQAQILADHSVVDLGCGTGTLALMVKLACPGARVLGFDGDRDVLAIAEEKVRTAGAEVELEQALASVLPVSDASIDRVLSSLVFHHLTTADKKRALAEAWRVLRPGGELHIADWGRPQNALMKFASLGIRFLDGAETTEANLDGLLPQLMENAGFVSVKETERFMTVFGTLSLYQGRR